MYVSSGWPRRWVSSSLNGKLCFWNLCQIFVFEFKQNFCLIIFKLFRLIIFISLPLRVGQQITSNLLLYSKWGNTNIFLHLERFVCRFSRSFSKITSHLVNVGRLFEKKGGLLWFQLVKWGRELQNSLLNFFL